MSQDQPIRGFYEAPGAADPSQRRALLLTHHFPPGQAAGALRWQKFVELSAAYGWGFDVLTLDPRCLGQKDPRRLADLPPGTRVFGVPDAPLAIERLEAAVWRGLSGLRARRAARAATTPAGRRAGGTQPSPGAGRPGSLGREEMRFVAREPRSWWRAYQAWVEIARGAAWARRAFSLGIGLFEPGRHVVVISSGPPEMAHVGACRLAARCGLPLVLDFRDPWSLRERLPEHMASPLWYGLARRHERRIARQAAAVVMNTELAREAMQAVHPACADRIVAIPNGCDDDPPPPRSESSGRFVIGYAGAIYLDRSPEILFRAAARVIAELRLTPDDLSIEFMGHVDPRVRVAETASAAGVGDYVHLHPPGTREEAAAFQARATMLLNLPQDSHLAIPSKIYEYMRYAAFLLVLAEEGSATEHVLRGTGADVVDPRDEAGIARSLRERYVAWRAGARPGPVTGADRLGRRARAAEIFALLDRLSAPGASPSPAAPTA